MQQPDFFNFLQESTPAYYSQPSSSSDPVHPPESSTSQTTNIKGTDFRRRKNWSERILVEITGLLHVLSPAGKILYCSESTFDLTGFRPHELVGQSLIDFLHVDDIDIFIRDFHLSFQTRSQIKTHFRFRKKDENYAIFEVVGHPKSDQPGQPPQSFFGIAQPVPSKSGAMIDAFLELKAENNWLKKRIDELSVKYGSSPGEESAFMSPVPQENSLLYIPTQSNSDIHAVKSPAWLDSHSSDLSDFMTSYSKEEKDYLSVDGPSTAESAERKDKWKRRKKHKGADEFVCADCGTTASPEWRKGPHGPKTLCNACGLRWAKKNKKMENEG
ncbi:hypothetical protein BDB01DRAFT_726012 [Pilobolus umbonatus]|nr:hypothetical protein BDB01DRAFT_726012 [Pilobolus umbonatus]